MKKSGVIVLSLILASVLLISSLNFASANWFTNIFTKATGNVVSNPAPSELTNGLVAYYPLDDDTNDFSGNGNSGVNNGSTPTTGKFDGAYSFDGVNDYIKKETPVNFPNRNEAFSLSAWVYPQSNNGSQIIMLSRPRGTGPYKAMSIAYEPNYKAFGIHYDSCGVFANMTASLNQWYNVVIIKPAGSSSLLTKIYVNGVEQSLRSNANSCNVNIVNDKFEIGAGWWNSDYAMPFNGKIDEVRIYNRALSAEEVVTLYNYVPNYTEPPVQTCTDSDGGLNYYVAGNITVGYSSGNGGGGGMISDVCLNTNLLLERYCDGVYGAIANYTCPNGCVGGACVNDTQPPVGPTLTWNSTSMFNCNGFLISDIITGDPYYLDARVSRDSTGERTNRTTIINRATGAEICLDLAEGDSCYLGNVVLEAEEIGYFNSENRFVKFRLYGATISDMCVQDPIPNETIQVCQSLINSIANPTSTEERQLNWNNTYRSSQWVNGQSEAYTEYNAAWNWNSPQYEEGQMSYYYVSYNVEVFDNSAIDLSETVSWNQNNPACKANSYWVNGEYNNYYICNWDALNNNQDIGNYQGNTREIFWYNDNVLVRMYIYYGTPLTDAQVTQLSQQRLNDLINNLQDNQNQYVDWSNFNIAWPAGQERNNALDQCGSDISEPNGLSWSCRMEPVICPPHGEQKRICTAWDGEEEQTYESTSYCTPGICSGCYIPRWQGEIGGQSKCIPYGFRFQTEDVVSWGESTQEDNDILTVQDAINLGEDIDLVVYPNNTALLTLETTANTYVAIFLEEGKEYDWEQLIGQNDENQEISIRVNKIYYSSTNYNSSYIDVTFIVTRAGGETIQEYNKYCDIDGQVKQQKVSMGGEWASCQNNYECFSNLCSGGECIDLQALAADANVFKATFVKVICKLSNLFDLEEYNQCVYKYLGEVDNPPSSGGSGGGSSSPPAMPA